MKEVLLLYSYYTLCLLNILYLGLESSAQYHLLCETDPMNVLLSLMYVSIIAFIMYKTKDALIHFMLSLYVITVIVPMLAVYSVVKIHSQCQTYVFMTIICFTILSICSKINISVSQSYVMPNTINLIIVILCTITILDICRYIILNGVEIFNLNFYKVYEYRLLLRETMTGLLAYLDSWVAKIFNPFCLICALYRKNKIQILWFLLLQIILFGFNSQKFTLFCSFVLIFLYYLAPMMLKSPVSLAVFFVLGQLGFFMANAIHILEKISPMFVALYHRIFVMPSIINFYYYEYFSIHGFDWFHQSFFRHFMASKYDLLLPRIIGLEYFSNPATNANTGFLASGYAQGGYIVMLIYSVIVGLIIAIIAACGKKNSKSFTLCFASIPLYSLFSSGDLPTSLLTGGLCWMILLLWSVRMYSHNSKV